MLRAKLDGNYLKRVAQKFITEDVSFADDDLLVFVDDTGHEKLPKRHHVFGLGGCAIFGHRYTNELTRQWVDLKQAAFGCGRRQPFHAKDDLPKMVLSERSNVHRFLERLPCKIFASSVTVQTRTGPNPDFMQDALCGIGSNVNMLVQEYARSDRWIFELSGRTQTLIMTTEAHLRYLWASVHRGISFMRKNKAEPGLEWADLIIYVAGHCLRSRLLGNPVRYADFHGALFADLTRGLDNTTTHIFSAHIPRTLSPPPAAE